MKPDRRQSDEFLPAGQALRNILRGMWQGLGPRRWILVPWLLFAAFMGGVFLWNSLPAQREHYDRVLYALFVETGKLPDYPEATERWHRTIAGWAGGHGPMIEYNYDLTGRCGDAQVYYASAAAHAGWSKTGSERPSGAYQSADYGTVTDEGFALKLTIECDDSANYLSVFFDGRGA